MATTTFDNLITFSRGSNATVTGPNGLIQWAPNNLLTFSQDFEAAAWTKTNATITANASVAPDGTTTADRLVNTALWGLDQSATLVAGLRYVISVWVRSGGTGKDTFILYGDGTQTSATFTATSSWVRVEYSFVATVSGSRGNGIFRDSSNNPVDIFIWGAQLELGSTATAYNNTSVRNLLGFSEAFDNAAWTKTRASIVTGAQANPVNGLFNAQKLMVDTATGTHRVISGAGATASGTRYTFSVYIKQGEYAKAAIGEFNNGTGWASFDLQAGTVLATGGTGSPSASITTAGSGWFRCAVTCTVGAFSRLDIYALNAAYTTAEPSGYSYTGDGNSGIYIYGAQLSNSASLDPYVPTPGAAPSSTAYYGPRFDYDPVTLAARGLLVEEARTNLLLRSEEFDNASWRKTATVTANQLVSPDGTSNADLISTNSNFQYVRQSITATANAQLTVSFFVKPVSGSTTVRVLLSDGPQTEVAGSNFSLVGVGSLGTTFTVGTGVLTSRSITKLGNGWYRCVVSGTINTTTPFGLIDNHSGGTMSFGVYGAQLELGAFATSYIPTIASTVTRSADVATITGQNFAQWYAATAGTFVADFGVIWSGNAPASMGVIGLDASASKRFVYISNGSQVASTFDGVLAVGTANNIGSAVNKVVSAYDTSRYIALNGGAVATGTLAAGYSSGTSLDIGKYGTLNFLNGHIRNIRFIPARAADFQLQALST